tara:strand:+ start:503 stop:682 length:180 start_codon:yes stop_codon:yes gene_type:complete
MQNLYLNYRLLMGICKKKNKYFWKTGMGEIIKLTFGVGGGILLAWFVVMLIKYYPQIKG